MSEVSKLIESNEMLSAKVSNLEQQNQKLLSQMSDLNSKVDLLVELLSKKKLADNSAKNSEPKRERFSTPEKTCKIDFSDKIKK